MNLVLNMFSSMKGIVPRVVVSPPPIPPMPSLPVSSNKMGFPGTVNIFSDMKPMLNSNAVSMAPAFALPYIPIMPGAGNIPPVPTGIITSVGTPGVLPGKVMSTADFWYVNGGKVAHMGMRNQIDMIGCQNAIALPEKVPSAILMVGG